MGRVGCWRTYGPDAAARCAFERTGPTAALPFVGGRPMRSRSDAMSKLSTGDRREERGRSEGGGKVGGGGGGEEAAKDTAATATQRPLFVLVDAASRGNRRLLNQRNRSRLAATLNSLIQLTSYSRLPTTFDPSNRGCNRISTVAMMLFLQSSIIIPQTNPQTLRSPGERYSRLPTRPQFP